MTEEEELQELLDEYEEPDRVESIVTYNGELTLFQYVRGNMRVQERRGDDGVMMQRVKVPYIGGEWSEWYNALEERAVKRK